MALGFSVSELSLNPSWSNGWNRGRSISQNSFPPSGQEKKTTPNCLLRCWHVTLTSCLFCRKIRHDRPPRSRRTLSKRSSPRPTRLAWSASGCDSPRDRPRIRRNTSAQPETLLHRRRRRRRIGFRRSRGRGLQTAQRRRDGRCKQETTRCAGHRSKWRHGG